MDFLFQRNMTEIKPTFNSYLKLRFFFLTQLKWQLTRSFLALSTLHLTDYTSFPSLYCSHSTAKTNTRYSCNSEKCEALYRDWGGGRSLEKCIWQTSNSRQFVQLPVQMCVSYCVAYCLHPFVTTKVCLWAILFGLVGSPLASNVRNEVFLILVMIHRIVFYW